MPTMFVRPGRYNTVHFKEEEEDEEKLLSDISATNSEDKEERRMGKTVFVLYNNKKEMKDELQRRITSRYIHHN